MPKFLKSPLIRISFCLSMLTVSLLLISDFAGFFPNTTKAELQVRKAIAESLAVQLSTAINYEELRGVQSIIDSVVERNPSALSVALRTKNNKILFESGPHSNYWTLQSSDNSTASQIQVGIFDGDGRWGNVEIRFDAITGWLAAFKNQQSFLALSVFIALLSFFAYMIFLRKVVHELNTDDVVPERVSKALDTLTEAILIVDDADFIVFSNEAFGKLCGETNKSITGKRTSEFNWYSSEDTLITATDLPWRKMGADVQTIKSQFLSFENVHGKRFQLAVNATVIGQSGDHVQGVLITFDNVSAIEAKNDQLEKTLGKLQQTQKEVTEQNQQLQILATRDPLTNTLNRRSLFQGLDTLISETFWENNNLSFVMVDIDHFKSVNDTYGHSTGDRVIVYLAQCLTENARATDLIARFGGEEFCLVLPNTQIEEAMALAERVRVSIQDGHGGDYEPSLKITASFGVSKLSESAADGETLLEQADEALYVAKKSGRNRVVMWQPAFSDVDDNEATQAPEKPEEAEAASTESEQPAQAFDETEISTLNDELVAQQPEHEEREVQEYGPLLQKQKNNAIPAVSNVLLIDRIDQAINRSSRYDTVFAVITLDIEILQRVNDTLGSAVGQKLLAAIIERLKTLVRDTDSVLLANDDGSAHSFSISSLGNRELVLLLTDLNTIDSLHTVTRRIAQSHKHPLIIEGLEYIFNANMGISLYPQDGSKSSDLLKCSSVAKNEAVQRVGESNVCFYHSEIEKICRQQIELEAELLRGIERDELVMFFQPKINLKSGAMVGVEALVRWQHPTRGLIPPDDFIPLAERTGLIEDLSRWVVRSVCKQIRAWVKQNKNNVHVSINLSPVEFRNTQLAQHIISTVVEFGIPPSTVEVEITEAIAMENMESAVQMLEEIAQAGIGISVDDFGTGYASLSYLQRLPINKIKIDKSFINGVLENSNDASIVSAVIAMGHTLGLEVVAEGVETREQMHFLQDLQCDQIQGYLISRPLPRDQLDELMQQAGTFKKLVKSNQANNSALVTSSNGTLMSIINQAPPSRHSHEKPSAE